ncbi:MAG: histidine phosphatase family protein [Eubacteriales bacterium]|nr:histidine phosphatase family protein [Eubacteriales bacterium]
MLIYLLRHGLTRYNAEKRYQGVQDIPLSPEGIAQLCRADFSPAVVYVTPLRRTQQTAERVFPEAEQIIVKDLREMDFGEFEGRNYIEMEHDPAYRAWVESGCCTRCPGGENKREFCDRTCGAFEEIVDRAFREKADVVVLLAHGGTQMAIMERYGLPKREFYQWCGPNAGGYVVETTEDAWRGRHELRLLRTVQYTKDGQM